MENSLPLIMSIAGGVMMGPIMAKVLGGSGTGGVIGGIIGGIGVHYGTDAAGLADVLGDEGLMAMIGNLAEGAVGGGIVGTILGIIMKPRL